MIKEGLLAHIEPPCQRTSVWWQPAFTPTPREGFFRYLGLSPAHGLGSSQCATKPSSASRPDSVVSSDIDVAGKPTERRIPARRALVPMAGVLTVGLCHMAKRIATGDAAGLKWVRVGSG